MALWYGNHDTALTCPSFCFWKQKFSTYGGFHIAKRNIANQGNSNWGRQQGYFDY